MLQGQTGSPRKHLKKMKFVFGAPLPLHLWLLVPFYCRWLFRVIPRSKHCFCPLHHKDTPFAFKLFQVRCLQFNIFSLVSHYFELNWLIYAGGYILNRLCNCFPRVSTAENSRLLVRKGLMWHFVAPGILPIRCPPHLYVYTGKDELANNLDLHVEISCYFLYF